DHCLKQGYECDPKHEYREALSAYTVPYMQRLRLLDMLEAAKRKEFDVLVVSEIRAISRRQVEVFVIYDMLQKYGVELETVEEKFEDSAMGRLLLSLRAAFAEIERDQSYLRLQRGKKDRMTNGAPNGHPKPAYGYRLVDTKREVKAAYEFNHTIIYVDDEGNEWSEYRVCMFIFNLLNQHASLRSIATRLNDIGIPPPRKSIKLIPHWDSSVLCRMMSNPIYIGEVWGNKYKKVKGKNGKMKIARQPREAWVRVGDAPAMIDRETFDAIQKQFAYNKQDSLRNNRHDEIGLLRSGYIFCGICGRRMHVQYPSKAQKADQTPYYRCLNKPGTSHVSNHGTTIHVPQLDAIAWQKVLEVLQNPEIVRARVEELRQENKTPIDTEVIQVTLADIELQMTNLFELAKHATNDTTISRLGQMMEGLEKQRRETEALLFDLEEDDEEREAVEKEIAKFEAWAEKVRPFLLDESYAPSYEEKRLAVRILGLRVTVYPSKGDYPYRYQIEVTVPEIVGKIKHIALQSNGGSHLRPGHHSLT
ncbi:MAG: recombinase family protein, partial [Ktedonobacteraceae bacterium]